MTVEEKIIKKGYTLRCNTGYINNELTIISYSAIKNGKAHYTALSKTQLLKKL